MLELPEAELVRRDLDKEIAGRKVKETEITGAASMFDGAASRPAFATALSGRKVLGVRRQGLTIIVDLSDDDSLLFTLGPGGSLRRHANKDAAEDGTVMTITFTQGGQLRLLTGDESSTSVRLAPTDDLGEILPAAEGFDPVDDQIPWTTFGQNLRARGNQKLRTLLMDDSFIVGIGPVYADEILHAALLRYDRTAESITIQEIRRLNRAIVEMMHNAIKQRGTTLENDPFVDVFGNPGGFTEYLEVYGRAGQRSRNGRGEVQKLRTGGQTHYYCDYQV